MRVVARTVPCFFGHRDRMTNRRDIEVRYARPRRDGEPDDDVGSGK